ncbi:class I SAM-dependent methyltransferase [Mycolicibacterium sp. BiH015]|uniref:class I SAM-dependent methyltransferase n=1 Tax=Mycolicibacterium sp. BiH015 TaxID=3018808 RepID=UPI0022E22675|nr:class I SAM-dependent methyltransferase [Mycolicibacterium sp. BiH015]MDA2890662.1 class I SAM-dependent methyltransferase [Mycolicibacterium sp. BiH015]
MADADRTRWDGRHRERGSAPPGDVALPAVFRPYAGQFPIVGHAVDLACGAGTAAVWLARRGLHVWGCDISPVAVAHAAELAARCGQVERCTFAVVDLDDGIPPGEPVDVLLCNKFRDRRLDDAMIERLAPGGILAINVLSEVGASPGPFRARPAELRQAFAALEVIASGEADGEAWLLARRR